ncbi:hypothetical protein J2Y67_003510 [Neobacillus niacini]|nr:hypothetical protein [Neobacillus niacini]
MEKFLNWVETSPFYGKNALVKAAEYTLNRANGLKVFLNDGRIEIDNNQPKTLSVPMSLVEKIGFFRLAKRVQ